MTEEPRDEPAAPGPQSSGAGPQSPGAGPQSPGAGPQSPGAGPQSPGAGAQSAAPGTTDAPPPASAGTAGYPAASASGPSGPRAGFGLRLGAFLIDFVVLTVIGFVLGLVLAVIDAGAGLVNLLGLIVGIAYYVYFEGGPTGQTVGKRLAGIRVVDFARGGSIGHGRAFVRYIGRILSTLPLLLGYFWMLWDKENQTWHDKLATSVVVPQSAYPVESWPS